MFEPIRIVLLVKFQNGNFSPGAFFSEGNKSLTLTREVNLNTQSSNTSGEEIEN